jgi:hypothetical protein
MRARFKLYNWVIKQAIKGKLVSSLKVPSLNTVEATLTKKLRYAVMRTFILDKNLEPLDPCHRTRARELLKKGRAKVFKRYPFTIVLQDRGLESSVTHCHRIKIDPGSKATGIAVVQERTSRVTNALEIFHRG